MMELMIGLVESRIPIEIVSRSVWGNDGANSEPRPNATGPSQLQAR